MGICFQTDRRIFYLVSLSCYHLYDITFSLLKWQYVQKGQDEKGVF